MKKLLAVIVILTTISIYVSVTECKNTLDILYHPNEPFLKIPILEATLDLQGQVDTKEHRYIIVRKHLDSGEFYFQTTTNKKARRLGYGFKGFEKVGTPQKKINIYLDKYKSFIDLLINILNKHEKHTKRGKETKEIQIWSGEITFPEKQKKATSETISLF